MERFAIFSATLGLSHPWQITSVSFSDKEKRIDIDLEFAQKENAPCPVCGEERRCCDVENETWRHHDFFRYIVFLHARVPRVECTCCGSGPVERPWTRIGSKFTHVQ